ncbi:MAG TPA: hypothetical protein VEJ86_01105 [Candidatus Binataceae bacterium]|nr:hypothetical protein [Candidatus Binataceae bacterium]
MRQRTKIGTALDRELLRRARALATREGKRLNDVIEDALGEHIRHATASVGGSVADRTAGCFKVSRRTIERVLRDEPGILDR